MQLGEELLEAAHAVDLSATSENREPQVFGLVFELLAPIVVLFRWKEIDLMEEERQRHAKQRETRKQGEG